MLKSMHANLSLNIDMHIEKEVNSPDKKITQPLDAYDEVDIDSEKRTSSLTGAEKHVSANETFTTTNADIS